MTDNQNNNSQDFQVNDKSSLHKYRTETPNIIEDLGLDPFAYRLYAHYKKVAGDSGRCYQKKKTISEITKMSPSVIKDRNKILSSPFEILNGKPLIKITQRIGEDGNNLPTLIEINDIWPDNFQILSTRFSQNPPSVARKPTLGREKATEQEPLKKNQRQQTGTEAVVVFSCLSKVDIPQQDKEWLSQNYLESRVELAVAFVNHPSTTIKQSLSQALKWHCKCDVPPIPTKTATDEKKTNLEYLEKNRNLNGTKSGEWVITVGTDYIEFGLGQCNKVFNVSDKNFIENIIEMDKTCRKTSN